MASGRAAPRRSAPFIDPPDYARHRPEETLLYRLIEEHYPAFLMGREAAGRPLPKHVRQGLEAYLKCGRLEHGLQKVHIRPIRPRDGSQGAPSCSSLVVAARAAQT